ncbi:trypsin-like peptidase domain-containing protein [Neobacillus sp. YIM B06451]|uniref:S1C family serine protease n=1 Tax=Neobacillus sp. YIM B06451 TaxID=3070994 RepID=UPI002930094F|nr:trypsin-like peptidase domain-containing protein [Neobacillus sp. YIM B06451]
MRKVLLAFLFLLSSTFFFNTGQASAADASFCAQFKGQSKIFWNGVELKPGQIGRLTVLQNTTLYKVSGEQKTASKTLKKGEFYRIYAFKPGMLSVGGGYYVNRDAKVKYETPSKAKLDAVKCISNPAGTTTPKDKTLTVQEIVSLNDDKVVLLNGVAGQGSGVLISKSLILTNEHVVSHNPNMTALFLNGQEIDIEGVVVKDADKDLAIVKLATPVSVKPATMGTVNSSKKGDTVVAIGSPIGLQNTVSQGLISSFRNEDGVSLIQTSASISFGSSGGGLFNTKGELIGITTAGIFGTSLNFAISIDESFVWKKYLATEHKSIPLLPKETLKVYLNDDMYVGMTKEQVKQANLVYGNLAEETADYLVFEEISYYDYPVIEVYNFKNGKLDSVAVVFLIEFKDNADGKAFFDEIKGYIEEDWDEAADREDTNWDDNIIEATWNGDDRASAMSLVVFPEEGQLVASLIFHVEK